ncbi:hypothetical protein OROMI_002638 [Orobanche minor]
MIVGDQSRGYPLELLLTKLPYPAGEGNVESLSGENLGSSSGKSDAARGLQIIGMSATLPNVAAVADWLQIFATRVVDPNKGNSTSERDFDDMTQGRTLKARNGQWNARDGDWAMSSSTTKALLAKLEFGEIRDVGNPNALVDRGSLNVGLLEAYELPWALDHDLIKERARNFGSPWNYARILEKFNN